jgi:hypothetical protein
MSERVYLGRRRAMTIEDWQQLGWTWAEAERYAQRGETTAEVLVADDDGVRPLRHFVRHSPAGFEWGLNLGSGCAELARCILLDHYRVEPCSDPWADDGLPVSYQAFKQDVIARLPRSGSWSLTSGEIRRWVQAQVLGRRP